jgi:hypothetical protein
MKVIKTYSMRVEADLVKISAAEAPARRVVHTALAITSRREPP